LFDDGHIYHIGLPKITIFLNCQTFQKTFFSKKKRCDENEDFYGIFLKMKYSKLIYYFARDMPKPLRYYNIVSRANLLLVI
jgi:hypothetical protein